MENPTQGVHIIIAFIDKATAKFFISSFNTRLNQPVDYNAVERWKSYVTRSWG